MKRRKLYWLVLAVGLVILLALAGVFLTRSVVEGSARQAVPVALSPAPDVLGQQIQSLQEQLNSGKADEEAQKSLRQKLEMAVRMATQQAGLRPNPNQALPPKEPTPTTSKAQQAIVETPEIAQGVFEGSQGLIKPSIATISNMWQGQVDGKAFQVFAGSQPDQPEYGLLMVVTLEPGRPTGKSETYPAPGGIDSLSIQEVNGTEVILLAKNGSKLAFDLTSRQFNR